MNRLIVLALALLVAAPLAAGAATIVIVNNDGPGEGFNDPTAVAPVGGNPGVTIGQQRLNVFQEAADIWGAILPSAVTIRVQSQFNALSCDASSAVLGSAGPIQVFRDFSGAEVPATWYHVALANKLAGVDLSAANDITATFNSSIDNNNSCLNATNWYYGLDGLEGTDVELLPVVLHELGHGLGFSTLVNLNTGSELGGFQDIYETFMLDNTTGLNWDQKNNGQRITSAVNTGNVVWDGPATTAAAPSFLGGTPTLFVNSGGGALPPTIPLGTANFGPALTSTGVTGTIVLVDDGVGTVTDACESLINGAAISGNIALIDRGTCAFTTKALAAQAAGAIAVIIANNVGDPDPITLGGTDPTVVIPVVSVTLADGNAIKAELPGVNVTLKADLANLAGADANGRVKLYAPNPLELGSSISHWDVTANPNLLMEPAINGNLSNMVDLTVAHFTDIGWLDGCAANTPPVAQCQNVVVAGAGGVGCTAAVTAAQIDNGSFDPDGDGFTLQLVPAGPYSQGVTPVDLIVTDDCGDADTCQAQITVTCGPVLQLEPATIIFNTVAFGDTVCDSVSVINTGDQTLNVSGITGCDTGGFSVDQSGFNATIAAGDTSKFVVCFTPTPAGADTCVLTVDSDGGSENVTVQVSVVTGIGDPGAGQAFTLSPVFPTPFATSAEVRFNLPAADEVGVDVFDFQGRLVRRLMTGELLSSGEQSVHWDGRDARGVEVAGGIYFIRVTTGDHGSRVMRAVRLNR